jgi:transposase-like protein
MSSYSDKGTFEIPIGELFTDANSQPCPKCNANDTDIISRDPVWEETRYMCNECNYTWSRG